MKENLKTLFLILPLAWVLLSCRFGEPVAMPRAPATPTPQISPSAPAHEPTNTAELPPGWTKIEPGGETRCAHDTLYAYWVRPGTSNKLLLYFQGGGGCWSAETCAPGSTFYDASVSENDHPASRGGILDFDNPDNPFREYHAVYIPSCTGDVHWGNNVRTYEKADGSELTIYHRGFTNAAAALEWAYTHVSAPQSIFITGCSAGSVGSIASAAYVIENYPEATVTQLGDSLAFVFHRPVEMEFDYQAQTTFPDWIPALASLDASALLMSDFYAAIAGYYPGYTFAQYNTEADSVQGRYYVAVGGEVEDFPGALAASLSAIHAQAANFRSYTAAGSLHCIMPRLQFYTLETEGVRFRDWVDDLAHGRSVPDVQCPTCAVKTE